MIGPIFFVFYLKKLRKFNIGTFGTFGLLVIKPWYRPRFFRFFPQKVTKIHHRNNFLFPDSETDFEIFFTFSRQGN